MDHHLHQYYLLVAKIRPMWLRLGSLEGTQVIILSDFLSVGHQHDADVGGGGTPNSLLARISLRWMIGEIVHLE